MVRILFKRQEGSLVSFEISGHSMFAESGHDIVCSAVSVLSFAILNGVTDILKLNPLFEVDEGYTKLDLKDLSKADISKCQVLLETMLLEIRSLEVNYNEYIRLKVEEV